MKGLFIKDLRLIKNQRNFLITLALMFLVLIVTGVDASFFMGYVPFLLLIVTMSTITYDEQDNSMGFLMALPVSRQTYVLEKYLFERFLWRRRICCNLCYFFHHRKGRRKFYDAWGLSAGFHGISGFCDFVFKPHDSHSVKIWKRKRQNGSLCYFLRHYRTGLSGK